MEKVIPEDIRTKALDLYDEWDVPRLRDRQALIDLIAEALAAERERCARIVDDHPSNDAYLNDIVAAIRNPA